MLAFRSHSAPSPPEVPLQPGNRLIQYLRPLAKREACVVPRRTRLIVKRGNRDRRHAGMFRDVAAKRDIVTVEPEPSSLVLGMLAAISFGLIADRKRRARVLLTLAK